MQWLGREELLAAVGITEAELQLLQSEFPEQMRCLTRELAPGQHQFAHEAVHFLRSVAAMRDQGATTEQIKGWFGLAAAEQDG